MKFISPMQDFMFKRMFSIPDSANILCDFLGSCIDFKNGELKDVKLIDKEIKTTEHDKDSILDLRVEVGNSITGISEVDVEVQLKKYSFLNNRIAYYLSKMFANQLCEGDNYDKLHKCVSLWVVKSPLFDDKEYFHSMVIQDKNGIVLTDKMEFDCLEIAKIREIELTSNMDKKLQWAKLFAASSEEELDMIGETVRNPAIRQAVLTVKKLTATEEMQLEALNREKAERDRISIDAEIRAEGRAEGIAEERAKAEADRAQIIANMRANGLPENLINSIMNTNNKQSPEHYSADGEDDSEEFEP